MKDYPIIFSSPMVRAILEGRKTQTRRVITPEPKDSWMSNPNVDWSRYYEGGKKMLWIQHPDHAKRPPGKCEILCPYGKPGDRLWVRETFATTDSPVVRYYATDDVHELRKKKPSIHMPRWASRITLEITQVRVQRVQEIDGEDAIAEGCKGIGRDPQIQTSEHTRKLAIQETEASSQVVFRNLWDSINSKRGYSWEENPWVWAITFKRLQPRSTNGCGLGTRESAATEHALKGEVL